MSRAIFLDRDGVINATVWNADESTFDTPYQIDQFTLLPGVAQAIERCHQMGFLVVVVSNQPGVAKGKCTPEFLEDVKALMNARLGAKNATLDGVYYCIHHPEASVADLRCDCDCRKPKPGLLLEASRQLDIDLRDSWMIGDQERDVLAGAAAGCRTCLVGQSPFAETIANLQAVDLVEAVEKLAAIENRDRAATW
jgi:D,D-heptose 1,7-bisphosphate phosphatase